MSKRIRPLDRCTYNEEFSEVSSKVNRVKVCLPFIIIFMLFYITFGDFVFPQLESPKMVLQSLSVFESVL